MVHVDAAEFLGHQRRTRYEPIIKRIEEFVAFRRALVEHALETFFEDMFEIDHVAVSRLRIPKRIRIGGLTRISQKGCRRGLIAETATSAETKEKIPNATVPAVPAFAYRLSHRRGARHGRDGSAGALARLLDDVMDLCFGQVEHRADLRGCEAVNIEQHENKAVSLVERLEKRFEATGVPA
jgi:hypothetical protein